jgi:hypothetical protein
VSGRAARLLLCDHLNGATLPGVNSLRPDAERLVDLSDDDAIPADSIIDDTDATWSERPHDDWLREGKYSVMP